MAGMFGGLAGLIKSAGDRAALNLYGDKNKEHRDQVWRDIAGGIGKSFGGGDVLGPAHDRLNPGSRTSPATPGVKPRCTCADGSAGHVHDDLG